MVKINEAKARPLRDEDLLHVDVCGIAMFLPNLSRVVVVDARKPRISVTNGSMIAPHMAMLGIEAGTYEKPTFKLNISFNYDIDGSGDPVRFDTFTLDGHTVRFKGVKKGGTPELVGKRFGSIKELSPEAELCTGVRAGSSRQVIGTVDFSDAVTIEGKSHKNHPGPLKFRNSEIDCADMAAAMFEADGGPPTIELQKGDETKTIRLQGVGPWRVMVGNFPVDEIIGMVPTEFKHEVPLTHLELYYDLYHVGRNALTVPVGSNHVHAEAPRTATGRCGPTLVPEWPVPKTESA